MNKPVTGSFPFLFPVEVKSTVTGMILLLALFCIPAYPSSRPALIPFPRQIEWEQGGFLLDSSLIFLYNIDRKDPAIREIRELLHKAGINKIAENKKNIPSTRESVIRVLLKKTVRTNNPEGYQLLVSGREVNLISGTTTGLYRGVQTLRQLVVNKKGKSAIQCCRILDWPAFEIRGFMQDVGRNYMPLPLLKEQIDVLATYKFNVFHFHVTDNPGWRLESKKYPQLKEPGSMSRWPGKYYSQEEFLELVNYCNDRYITLIPELDVPGHCEAFRKALNIESMSDPRVKIILTDLIDELCGLVPAGKMPFIHIGTDEVWNEIERPAPDLLPSLIDRIRRNGRKVMVWRPGQTINNDSVSITQLWSSNGHPKAGHPYIDSRLNYLNHLDPLSGIPQLFFDRICGAPHGDSLRLGGILCCWNDNNVSDPADILRQNPVYPGILTYSESSWRGLEDDPGENYLAKLPLPGDPFYRKFREFEERLVAHRDLYFQGKPFPYVKQSEVAWNLIGPFDNKGDVNRQFPVEEAIKKVYEVDGKAYSWKGPFYGGTIHISHFFGFPSWFTEKTGTVYATTKIWSPAGRETGFWIGFYDWSRSGGRRGGPFPQQGQWLKTNPKVWVNGQEISPPEWDHPGMAEKSEEIPFTGENYFIREPARIMLKKGWNQVLLKIPQDGTSWKWMFTFLPVERTGPGIHEVKDIKFKSILN